jgi:hypothetical protein
MVRHNVLLFCWTFFVYYVFKQRFGIRFYFHHQVISAVGGKILFGPLVT